MFPKSLTAYDKTDDGGSGGTATTVVVEPATAADESRQQHTVPLVELQKERKSKKDLEARLAAAEKTIADTEAASLSENEQLKAKLAAADAKAAQHEAETAVTAKSNLVRTAASTKGFTDAEDAIAQLSALGELAAIETAAEADAAVAALATAKPYLLRTEPAACDKLTIEQILANGLSLDQQSGVTRAAGDDGVTLTRAQMLALSSDQMEELMTKHPEKFQRSVEAQKP